MLQQKQYLKKIILVGKGASGKNFLMEKFEKRGFRHIVSHTTRQKRKKEQDGCEYHFISRDEFKKMVENNEFLEYQKFGDNYYGISKREWDISDIAIMAPQGVENLKRLGVREDCFVIYVDIPYHVRKERLCKRNGSHTEDIERRLTTDESEFRDFNDYDLRIENPNF